LYKIRLPSTNNREPPCDDQFDSFPGAPGVKESAMLSSFFVNPRSNPELRSLFEVASIPQNELSLPDYFGKVMTTLSTHFPIDYSALILRDPQKEYLRVEGLYGVDREAHPVGCSFRKGPIGQVLQSRRPMAIQSLSEEPLYDEITKGKKRSDKIQAPLICVPLVAEDGPIGVINVNSIYGPRAELTEDFEFLSILSAILSPPIRNYQIRKQEALAKSVKAKAKSIQLEDLLKERLVEVLNKIDPYVETKARMTLLDDIIATVEKILIRSALEKVDNVQVAAAQLLGINRNTLRKKIKDLKIKVP
jgi:transcriptional regulator with GAF, ATPase, and Fis domain